jgi:hypothetical protein
MMNTNITRTRSMPVNVNLIGVKSKYNKYGFREGDTVILDDQGNNSKMVMIKENTIVGLYAQVHGINESPSDSYTVLTSRLSPIS